MSLYETWKDVAYEERDEQAYNIFWEDYLTKEQGVYEAILSDPTTVIRGSLATLAETYNMSPVFFAGYMDGINSSLKESVALDSLTETSTITLDVDLEKLYYNMLDAGAEWLYELPAWDAIFTTEKRKEIRKAYNATKTVVKAPKVGRNDPCPCGSGRKYKQCCLNK